MIAIQLHHATAGLIGVSSEVCAWMLEVLAPYARPALGSAGVDVVVEVVDVLPVSARAEPPGWPSTTGVTAGADPERGRVFVQADPSREEHRIAILQTVRGLLVGLLLQGSTPLHAAVLSIDGVGVVLAGPKGAGKTSFTSALLRAEPRSAFVTNDKAYVQDGLLHGLPFAVLVGHDGLRRTPELAGARHRPTMDKAAFWPGEFATSFGREAATTVAPAVGIWCDARFDTDTLLLQTLDPATVEQVVPTALADFSQAMLPVHLSEGLRGPSFGNPPPAPDWAGSLRWLHARGNPWALGPSHLHALRFAGKETIGS